MLFFFMLWMKNEKEREREDESGRRIRTKIHERDGE